MRPPDSHNVAVNRTGGNFYGWLDLFSVRMDPPDGRLEKAAMVLDRTKASQKNAEIP
jgi:hypothetical protein